MAQNPGSDFIRKTKHVNLGASDQQRGTPPPSPFELFVDDPTTVELPPTDSIRPNVDFHDLVTNRRSLRNYADTPFSLEELSYLLWCSHGVKESGPVNTLRTVPSAGARHALDTIVLANRVDALDPGLYHYSAAEHCLANLHRADAAAICRACYDQRFVLTSAAVFIWVAIPYRMSWRYGERGYRYLHLDVGHVCQNLYLAAESIDSGVCAIAAYDDDVINDLLGLDGTDRFVIYLAAAGKKPNRP